MNALDATLAAWLLCVLGAVAVACAPSRPGARLFAALVAVESVLLGTAGARALAGEGFGLRLWSLGPLGHPALGLDRLGGLFALAGAVVFLATAAYAAGETTVIEREAARRAHMALYQLLLASVLLVLAAGDAITLVFGWEMMSLLIYALLGDVGPPREGRRPAYLMLALGEAGTLAALAGVLLLAAPAGGLDFAHLRAAAPAPAVVSAAILLAFFGFGVKAGVVPFNQWLVPAYAAAPRGFVPVLAGVTSAVGVYAVVRVGFDLAAPGDTAAGVVVMVTGAGGALIGILYATIQPDLRRTLAHSSIEHMGIVFTAIGAAMVFAAAGQRVLAAMALIAALYHLLNHALFKALLFVGSGAVERAAGGGVIDRLGGLARTMPATSALVLCGVLAIAALPPLNGFVSEWLTLQSLLRGVVLGSTAIQVTFALCGAALALSAGLAVTCFAKFYAMGFLGMARSRAATRAGEAPAATRAGMAALALACVLLGLLPTAVIPVLGETVAPLVGDDARAALVPPFFDPSAVADGRLEPAFSREFDDLGARVGRRLPGVDGLVVLHRGASANPVVFAMSTSYTVVVLGALLALTWAAFTLLGRGRTHRGQRTWDGGLRRLRASSTYSATGFSNPVRVVFEAVLKPRRQQDTTRAVSDHFRTAVRVERVDAHPADRLLVDPAVRAVARLGAAVRRMHGGGLNAYAAYVLIVLVAVLTAIGLT